MVTSSIKRRIFRDSGLSEADGHVQFDNRWHDFERRIPEVNELAQLSDLELCTSLGLDQSLFETVVTGAIRQWRVSPSRSLIHILDGFGENTPSGPIFASVVAQSRVIFAAVKTGILPAQTLLALRGANGKPVLVSQDAQAVTVDADGATALNEIARMMRAWELRNRARAVARLIKVPRVLFRGIRSDAISDTFERERDEPYELARSRQIDRQAARLSSEPLRTVLHAPILSFSSTPGVANRFANGEGFVVAIAPEAFSVVCAWVTDKALDGKDEALGIHEREWIVRLSPDHIAAREGITISDRTYAMATNDPTGITMLRHHDHATYELEGRTVRARHRYNPSGVGGQIVFSVDRDHWEKGRRTYKKDTGFDPVPGGGREATNLIYFHQEPFSDRKRFYQTHPPTDPPP
ncbi:hypothetical protein GCM10019059_40870 [Camelimonas fluminis]|uniref:Uncharacterized protein n=1 Tax=Camelimonas fluminis TaxID=1576911 RepID=A0ABV7UBR7_9HYPH|nr:hypothetical protein [Camelimonas fluminis]GHE77712.1 hypothetical protein GCM10019059_40870 [Camelimonas fluminis]